MGEGRIDRRPLGHADRHIHMHRPRLPRDGERNRLGHARPDRAGGQAKAALDHGAQHRLMVENLMGVGRGLGFIDAAGQKDQRHPILHRVRNHVDRIGNAGSQRRHQHRQAACHVPQPLGHEPAAVFMLDQHKAEARCVQPLHQGQNLAPRDAEGVRCPGLRQSLADDVRAGCHASKSPEITPAAASARSSAFERPKVRVRTAPVSAPKAGGALA